MKRGSSSSFREDCDKAAQIMERFNHMGYAELQYELNVGESRLNAVTNYLREKLGYIEIVRRGSQPLCRLHSKCLMSRTELEKLQKERDAKEAIRLKETETERKRLEMALDTFKELAGVKNNPVSAAIFIDAMVAKQIPVNEAEELIKSLNRGGLIYEIKPGFYRKQ